MAADGGVMALSPNSQVGQEYSSPRLQNLLEAYKRRTSNWNDLSSANSLPVASGAQPSHVPHPPTFGTSASGARSARSPVRKVLVNSAVASGAARGSLSARPSDSREVTSVVKQPPVITEPLTVRAGTEVPDAFSNMAFDSRVTQSARAVLAGPAFGSGGSGSLGAPTALPAEQMADLRSRSEYVRVSANCAHAPEAIARRMDDVARRYYRTSYIDQFPSYPPEKEEDYDRPRSSYPFGACYELGQPIGHTTYSEFFGPKPPYARAPEIRTGSASGDRANNPHPSREFLVWRYPRRTTLTDASRSLRTQQKSDEMPRRLLGATLAECTPRRAQLSNSDADRAQLAKYTSIYREDFKHPPLQNIRALKSAELARLAAVSSARAPAGAASDGASSVPATITVTGLDGSKVSAPYSLDSSQRHSYRPMARHAVLAVPHTRFGSNAPPKSEITQLPITSSVYKYMNGRTTYDTDLNDRVLRYYYGVENVRDAIADANADAAAAASLAE